MSGPVRRRPQSRRRSVEFGKEMGGMFQKIIVPVDGSESSWRALEQGLSWPTSLAAKSWS